jgi:hypothetical protein
VFNDVKSRPRAWTLGDKTINEMDSYLHLGAQCNNSLNINMNISISCDKLRKPFFSIVDCGIYRNGLHPLTCKKIYVLVVLPKALYGSELSSGITETKLHPLYNYITNV